MTHKLYGGGSGETLRGVDTGNFRNDLATLFHIEHVPFVDVESVDNVFVVERRAFHYGARQEHRVEVGHGGDDAHAAHFKRHEAQLGQRPFGGKFVGYGPAG